MKVLNKIRIKIYIIYLASKWIFRINLGDYIVFDNEKYSVTNGIYGIRWHIFNKKNGELVPLRTDCRKVMTVSNYIGSFKSGYKFYMGYWYSILLRRGIRYCKNNWKQVF